ncbi:MAG: sigma-54-dependent Fis family transcriptional regulator [Planctomycetales bacterium]|nr:sigma-54-dependent Fis family transcriptional regulator [Planctomycetales bacterium]
MTSSPAFSLLIVEDEVNIREGLRAGLQQEADLITACETADDALEAFCNTPYSVVVTDIQMPGVINGLELLERILNQRPETTVIVITAHGTVDLAVQAMRLGAFDFISKPLDLNLIRHQIRKVREFQTLREENRDLRSRLANAGEISHIIGSSPAMQRVYHQLRQVAATDATLLVEGESGTGKELIARSLHDLSGRCGRPFVPVNLAALPDTLIEAEMFGYEKGAFSGALRRKPGFFEQADSGTLFLDEVTEMTSRSQVDLLRVLETGQFTRLGGEQLVTVDVRVAAATNRRISDLVQTGAFREDLFYRLNVFPIALPALRERREDIPLLVEHFLSHFRRRYDRRVEHVAADAMQALMAAPWPGNVRQLRNIVERLVIMAPGEEIQHRDLPVEIRGSEAVPPNAGSAPLLSDLVAECEIAAIKAALTANDGHRERAAQQLGVSLRTIHNKMSRYDIH